MRKLNRKSFRFTTDTAYKLQILANTTFRSQANVIEMLVQQEYQKLETTGKDEEIVDYAKRMTEDAKRYMELVTEINERK